jgi:hypothetical protein
VALVDGHAHGLAVCGAGRGEDEAAHAGREQRVEQRDAARDVVLEVELRLRDRLADVSVCGEVYARLDAVLAARARDQLAVSDVAFVKRHAAFDRRTVAARQIVYHDDRLAGLAQRLDHHASDVAGPAGHEH